MQRTIGREIQRLREQCGKSQSWLANQAGVSPRNMQRIEAGQSIKIQTLEKIAEALKVPIGHFFHAEAQVATQIAVANEIRDALTRFLDENRKLVDRIAALEDENKRLRESDEVVAQLARHSVHVRAVVRMLVMKERRFPTEVRDTLDKLFQERARAVAPQSQPE